MCESQRWLPKYYLYGYLNEWIIMPKPVHGIVASNHQRRRGDLQIAPTHAENATIPSAKMAQQNVPVVCVLTCKTVFSKWINIIWYYLSGFMQELYCRKKERHSYSECLSFFIDRNYFCTNRTSVLCVWVPWGSVAVMFTR